MNKMFTVFFLVIFVAIIPALLFAGTTGKIAGNVKDANTGDALAGANVLVVGTTLGAVTDLEGQFNVINIPPGTYNVRVTMMGYKVTTITAVRIKIDMTTTADFSMQEQVLEGEEVTIVAEKPKVELDLTASKQAMTKEEIDLSWGTDLKQVISDLPGTNFNGGIRGSFGLDVAYHLDGMDLRDVGSNTNFSSINLTSIQELEVLTGGWNAEYGQANGAIINTVTRSATDKIHGVVSYKFRPAGKYHWGRNIFDENGVFRTTMTTPEFWDKNAQWKTEWMDEPRAGYDGGRSPFNKWTPEQRAAWWKAFVNDEKRFPQMNYAERMQWETEVTLYGPITRKLGFMISGRHRDGVGRYPSALRYNPDMTYQGSLNYSISPNSKLSLTGMYTKFDNSGAPRTNFQSSEETTFTDQEVAYLRDPYSRWLYWLYGSKGNSDVWTIRPPEKARLMNFQLKFTHVFNPTTFLEVALQHSDMEFKLDYLDIAKASYFEDSGWPMSDKPDDVGNEYIEYQPGWGTEYWGQQPPKSFWDARWGYAGDVWRNWVDTRSSSIKADFTSQITHHHQIKAGLVFSLQEYDKMLHTGKGGSGSYAQVTDMIDTKTNPFEGALYLQDKMEFEGMTINAGLRLDFFNANRSVSSNVFDPLMISDETVGNPGTIGLVSYDPNGSGPGYTDTPTRWALSPRLGVSHPISENTVLHFMYGKFNQRPPWQKILSNPIAATSPIPDGMTSEFFLPDTTLVTYRFYTHKSGNPGLTWEKMTQYELGFEQNIADMFSLDVTLYYKDANNLTSRGITQGPADTRIAASGGSVDVRLYGDPNDPSARKVGETIETIFTTVNGAWADVRGIESVFETKFRYINAKLNYTMSFLSTGRSHIDRMYKEHDDVGKLGEDRFVGASNTDNGGNGIDDDSWNPHSSAFLKIMAMTPGDFGPSIGNIHPLGNWTLSTSTSWADGNAFTYYSPDYTGTQTPNNSKWKDRWNTNMNLARRIGLMQGINAKFYMQVTNLFNQKHLKLPGGDDRRQYFEEDGLLPFNSTTREPLEWSWYSNAPRIVNFGVMFDF